MSSVQDIVNFRCLKFIQIGILNRMRAMKETKSRKVVAMGWERGGGEKGRG